MPTKRCRVYVGLPNYDGVMCRDVNVNRLCMIDDDAVVAPDFLEAWLSYDKDIIVAPYVNRFPPFER